MNASSVADYITCSQHNSGGDLIPVQALWHVRGETEQSKAAAFRATFGIALWAAALIHILGVEIYVNFFHLYTASSQTNLYMSASNDTSRST